jgi:hypothetical protein
LLFLATWARQIHGQRSLSLPIALSSLLQHNLFAMDELSVAQLVGTLWWNLSNRVRVLDSPRVLVFFWIYSRI